MTSNIPSKPRVGIPWRTSQEESQQQMDKLRHYFDRVREAGGEPVHISLLHSGNELEKRLHDLDGFVLPGSPADVDPALYGAARSPKTVNVDANRDRTDLAILDHSVRSEKPVLAICYGCQVLNVFCGGTLVQDLISEKGESVRHGKTDLATGAGTGDLQHAARLMEGSRLEKLAGTARVTINTSHHQAIDEPGKNLVVSCRSEDGVIEGVEWTGGKNWILGAQWHPERMPEDPFARKIFQDFVSTAAARSHVVVEQKG